MSDSVPMDEEYRAPSTSVVHDPATRPAGPAPPSRPGPPAGPPHPSDTRGHETPPRPLHLVAPPPPSPPIEIGSLPQPTAPRHRPRVPVRRRRAALRALGAAIAVPPDPLAPRSGACSRLMEPRARLAPCVAVSQEEACNAPPPPSLPKVRGCEAES